MSDRAVLDTDFALHDAQQVIAEELGFGSWAEAQGGTTDVHPNPGH